MCKEQENLCRPIIYYFQKVGICNVDVTVKKGGDSPETVHSKNGMDWHLVLTPLMKGTTGELEEQLALQP